MFQPVSQTAQRNRARTACLSLSHFSFGGGAKISSLLDCVFSNFLAFSTYMYNDAVKYYILHTSKGRLEHACFFLILHLHVLTFVTLQVTLEPKQPAPLHHLWPLHALVNLFSRNSRMWTGRSTKQTCPPWPRRPPRAARTSTSCRSLRFPCRSQSNLLDQVSHSSLTS